MMITSQFILHYKIIMYEWMDVKRGLRGQGTCPLVPQIKRQVQNNRLYLPFNETLWLVCLY